MPKLTHARVALGAAAIVTAAGCLLPTSHGATSIGLTGSSLAPPPTAHPGVAAIGSRTTAVPSPSSVHQVRTARPTPEPTPAPPPPPPAPPPPPTAGGLNLIVDPVVFKDETAAHPGTAALGMMAWTGVLVDADSRTVLWDNHAHLPMPPASTTKIVSSLVALHNFAPDKSVTITPEALTQASDETRMGLAPGETLTVEELLGGMLTVSANDAATAMAVDTVGMDNFVAAMNAQMQQLGLHDSHFTTPVGLDDPQQYASAYDLAAVAMEDMTRFPVFGNIVDRTQVNLPQTGTHKAYELPNLNRELQVYPAAVGVKPGYTGNAGPCLVAEAVRGGHHLIGVVLQDNFLYTDMAKLFDWGFAQYGLPPLG
ncbi:MAG TPA: serine hydrolase [Candidatus Angelobacter sp.]|nr:serine hydrolase [Candidatus Angelobacter sp.]